jgi:hypothetical protein
MPGGGHRKGRKAVQSCASAKAEQPCRAVQGDERALLLKVVTANSLRVPTLHVLVIDGMDVSKNGPERERDKHLAPLREMPQKSAVGDVRAVQQLEAPNVQCAVAPVESPCSRGERLSSEAD